MSTTFLFELMGEADVRADILDPLIKQLGYRKHAEQHTHMNRISRNDTEIIQNTTRRYNFI